MTDSETYQKAKEAYYNGKPIMSDLEFDQLEKSLGLENAGYVGTKHSENYTVKHPFIMGTLAKVQIKENEKKTGDILKDVDWADYADQLNKYSSKADKPEYLQLTPKFDGCSFELQFSKDGSYVASTRGDGTYGKDITPWISAETKKKEWSDIQKLIDKYCIDSTKSLIVRGEILIDSKVFKRHYESEFTNPRSFVASAVGSDWIGTEEQLNYRRDLSFVCYDYRVWDSKSERYTEIDYTKEKQTLKNIGNTPDLILAVSSMFDEELLYRSYKTFKEFRDSYKYMLDGIVVKPNIESRLYNPDTSRPKDCVAIKFLPEIVETEIMSIEWSVGKSGEFYPKAVCKQVVLGDKMVKQATLHNYNYLIENECGIGSKIQISLAGDIIPFVYKVLTHSSKIDKPKNSYVYEETSNVKHLMKMMTAEELEMNKFLASSRALDIMGIGSKVTMKLHKMFPEFSNILDCMRDSSLKRIREVMGDTKSADNIIQSLMKRRSELTLDEVILSCCFKQIGSVGSKICASVMNGDDDCIKSGNFSRDIYMWALPQENSSEEDKAKYNLVMSYKKMFNLKNENIGKIKTGDKKKVILTGSPADCTSFKTKGAWLNAHTDYEETTNWKEAAILFTSDLESTSNKMAKAKKNNIEIKLYED